MELDRLKGRADLDDQVEEVAGTIHKECKQMSAIIDGLLAYARAGQLRMDSLVDLNELVADVLQSLKRNLEEADATIVLDELPSVRGNPAALQQVFNNLVGNALKYSDPGSVRIEIAGGCEDDWAWIRVKDYGEGIPPSKHDSVFEMFYRVGDRDVSGVGMGLAIVRKLVDAHGGRIELESQPGKGSAFTVWLRREESDAGG